MNLDPEQTMSTPMSDKRKALTDRLALLDADAKRIVEKRKVTEAQLKGLDTKDTAPKKAEKAKK